MSLRSAVSVGLVALSLALAGWAVVTGYLPGDVEGSRRMRDTRDNALIAAGFAVVALAPLGWFRWVLLGLAVLFLLLAIAYWTGLYR